VIANRSVASAEELVRLLRALDDEARFSRSWPG